MSHYKDLNKELVEQVQAMRISLQEHRDEIIHLRQKLMIEHENMVYMRKKCQDLALLHCRQYLEMVDADSTILPLLRMEQETPKTPVQQIGTNTENGGTTRNSARLTVQYRRSCSFTRTRKSFNETSPIRSPSCFEVEDEEDLDVFETDVQSSAAMVRNASILEEVDEEKENEGDSISNKSNYSDKSTRILCQSMANERKSNPSNVHIVERRDTSRTFRDITNSICTTNTQNKCTSKQSTEQSKHHSNSRRKQDTIVHPFANLENEDPNGTTELVSTKKSNHVTVSRGAHRNKKQTDVHISPEEMTDFEISDESLLASSTLHNSHQESIQEARHMVKEIQNNGGSFHAPRDEVTASSYALSDITFTQFHQATSSTPRQHLVNGAGSLSSPDNHCSRPRRSCKPKSLVEPRANRKMRNESAEKSLSSEKQRKKKSSH